MFLMYILVVASAQVALGSADQLPTCQPNNFRYSFTECDTNGQSGGRWRVSVPKSPNSCVGGNPNAPVRVDNCYTSCGSGYFFNSTGLVCQKCSPGTYSLGGGVKINPIKNETLKELGFRIRTESKNFRFKQDQCPQWRVTDDGFLEVKSPQTDAAGGCVSVASFNMKIVKSGLLRFTYQYVLPGELSTAMLFSFHHRNYDEPGEETDGGTIYATSAEDYNIRFPAQTDERKKWATVELKIKTPGFYSFVWKSVTIGTSGSGTSSPSSSRVDTPEEIGRIKIKSIELNGVAYASECTPCEVGTFTAEEGESRCSPCSKNTFTDAVGSTKCTNCDTDIYYAPIGANSCSKKPFCSQADYYEVRSDCSSDTLEQEVSHKWIQPKICRDGSLKLPSPRTIPCNATSSKARLCSPGLSLVDDKCLFCEDNTFNDGTSATCEPCPPSTAPVYSLVIDTWKSELNENSDIGSLLSMQCILSDESLGMTDADCDATWQVTPATVNSYLQTSPSAQLDAYLILTLTVSGFRHSSGGQLSFEFELRGDDSRLLFIETKEPRRSLGNTVLVEQWKGDSGGRKMFRYDVHENITATYSWMYRRETFIQSHARIYSITVRNALSSGAVKCVQCPRGSEGTGCVPCPSGQYLDVGHSSALKDEALHTPDDLHGAGHHSLRPTKPRKSQPQCVHCPVNTAINGSLAFPKGRDQSCIPCGPGLISNHQRTSCLGNCSLTIGEDRFDLSQLPRPLTLKAANLFTAGGTAYFHVFNISLCGQSTVLCENNITEFGSIITSDKEVRQSKLSNGISAMACKSTIVPDRGELFATQSASIGDQLVAITRDITFDGIKVHLEFTNVKSDIHFFYSTDATTSACKFGRATTVTLRCALEQTDGPSLSAPKSCPDATCDGCNFHFLVKTNSSAACRECRDSDYEQVVGECIAGQQMVHLINPKGCVIPPDRHPVARTCAVLPKQVQLGIALVAMVGVILIFMVFHFWKKNRQLEYKYSKLCDNDKVTGELPGAECCAEDDDDDDVPENEPSVKVRQAKRESRDADYDGYETIQLTKHTDDDVI